MWNVNLHLSFLQQHKIYIKYKLFGINITLFWHISAAETGLKSSLNIAAVLFSIFPTTRVSPSQSAYHFIQYMDSDGGSG